MEAKFITVWQDGTWKVQNKTDDYYAQQDKDWFVSIPIIIRDLFPGSKILFNMSLLNDSITSHSRAGDLIGDVIFVIKEAK